MSKTKTFEIDLEEYKKALAATKSEQDANKKGKSLEDLAKLLFEAITFLSYKGSRETSNAQIDLVFFYKGFEEATIFDELGLYFLVECKNWKETVGAKHVRDFVGKMQASRVQLGVLLAPRGVTGATSDSTAAMREINLAYFLHGLFVVVVTEDHLKRVKQGANFYEELESEVEVRRFGKRREE